MSDELAAVKRTASRKRRTDKQYRAALLAALEAGHGYAELAKVAGTSRQAVRQLILRTRARS